MIIIKKKVTSLIALISIAIVQLVFFSNVIEAKNSFDPCLLELLKKELSESELYSTRFTTPLADSISEKVIEHVINGDFEDIFFKTGMHTDTGFNKLKTIFLHILDRCKENPDSSEAKKILNRFEQLGLYVKSNNVEDKILIFKTLKNKILSDMKVETLPNGVIHAYIPGELITKQGRKQILGVAKQNEIFVDLEKNIYGKCLFPNSWTKENIKEAGDFLLKSPVLFVKYNESNKVSQYIYETIYKGVKVRAIANEDNIIKTIFPAWNQ